jgi:hypothetical protein
VNIFLDLFIYISLFSSTFACGYGEHDQRGPFRRPPAIDRRRMQAVLLMRCDRLNERRDEIPRTETKERGACRGNFNDPE